MKTVPAFFAVLSFVLLLSIHALFAQSKSLNLGEAIDKSLNKHKTVTVKITPDEGTRISQDVRDDSTFINRTAALWIFILIEIFLGVTAYIAFKRKLELKRKRKAIIEKKSISFIRNEHKIIVENTKLAFVRKNLRYKQLGFNNNNLNITKTAKKNSISKGEVFLAMKLNKLALRTK